MLLMVDMGGDLKRMLEATPISLTFCICFSCFVHSDSSFYVERKIGIHATHNGIADKLAFMALSIIRIMTEQFILLSEPEIIVTCKHTSSLSSINLPQLT